MSVLAGGRDRDRRSKGPKPEAGTGAGRTVAEDRQVESDGDRKSRTWTGGLDLPRKGRSAEDGSV